jgi:hypothetical protein
MSSLGYNNQKEFVAIGSLAEDGTRTGETLTATSADTRYSFPSGGYSKVDIAMLYIMSGAETGNGISLIIEQSPDGDNWYRIPNESVVDGTSTLAPRVFEFVGDDGTSTALSVGIDVWYKNLRISIAETGVASTNGTVFAHVTVSE